MLAKGERETVVSIRTVRHDLQCPPIVALRLGKPSHLVQDISPVEVSGVQGPIQLQGHGKGTFSFLEAAQPHEGIAQVEVGLRVTLIGGQGMPAALLGLPVPSQICEEEGKVGVSPRVPWLELGHPGGGLHRLGGTAELPEGSSLKIPGQRMAGPPPRNGPRRGN